MKVSQDDILKYFSYFFQQTGFDISCTMFPMETICRKVKSCFLGKLRKIVSICHLLNLPSEWERFSICKSSFLYLNLYIFIHISESRYCVALYSEEVNLQTLFVVQWKSFWNNYLCSKSFILIVSLKKFQYFHFSPQ